MQDITEIDVYMTKALHTLKPMESKSKQLEYGVLALCGEAGEMANLLKKKVYHNKESITNAHFIDEASDVLWYLACIADALGVKLSDIANHNINKLTERYNGSVYTEDFYKQ